MAKLTLTDLANLQNESTATSAINANNTAVEAALENTLSRDGTTPNTMEADLDLNDNDILNVGTLDATALTVGGLAVNTSLASWEGGIAYTFNATTTMADPGTGELRLNNAASASATAMSVSDLTALVGNPSVEGYISGWADSSSTIKGVIHLVDITDPTTFLIADVTGLIDNAGWVEIAFTVTASNNNFTAADNLAISFAAKGDQGSAITGMPSATYDPNTVEADVFNMANMVEAADAKVMTSTERTKLSGIETAATADQTGAQIKVAYEAEANTNAYTDAEVTKLAGIETGATADQTAGQIKQLYEGETSAFTDTLFDKLAAIEAAADVTDETNVTAALDGATLTAVTVVSADKVIIQDASDTDNIKTVTAQSIADLNTGGSPEGTAVLSTGEAGGTKFLREDGDGTSSWQTISGGGDALVANPLSQFAATSSAQLAGVMSDETGSGALVFGTTPTLTTPVISGALTTNSTLDGRDVATDGTKLDTIATGATNNDTDANLVARANHTGTQLASTISDFSTAADARITAGLGSTIQAYDADTAKLDVAQSFTAFQAGSNEAMADGVTITPTGTKHYYSVTLGGNRTIDEPTTITIGGTYVFKITQDATGGRSLSWHAVFDWAGGTPPDLTATASGVDVFSGVSIDGTSIQMVTVGQAFS